MSDSKHIENDPERALVTLDQLSQTIEVMTGVVNRLRRHLSEQVQHQLAERTEAEMDGALTMPRASARAAAAAGIAAEEAAGTRETGARAAGTRAIGIRQTAAGATDARAANRPAEQAAGRPSRHSNNQPDRRPRPGVFIEVRPGAAQPPPRDKRILH